ncbi:MAG: hypothetical protein WCT04_24540 [Planctomycetota bacterium]
MRESAPGQTMIRRLSNVSVDTLQPATRPSKLPRRVLYLWTLRLPFRPELLREERREQLRASERTAQGFDGHGDTVFVSLGP